MDPRAIQQAQLRLHTCRGVLIDIRDAKTYQDFVGRWYLFLMSWKGVYTSLEQGSKNSAQSRQWFGAKKAERRSDELLQYMFEARNSDEHDLEEVTALRPGGLGIGTRGFGLSKSIRIDGTTGPGGVLRITALDGLPVGVVHHPPRPVLRAVNARGDRVIPPPTRHKGTLLPNQEPLTVATLALAYAEALVAEAASLG